MQSRCRCARLVGGEPSAVRRVLVPMCALRLREAADSGVMEYPRGDAGTRRVLGGPQG
jgi:hypothetical protein